jgi:hypothetical protein
MSGATSRPTDALALGARLNQTYSWALKRAPASERLEAARQAAEDYLAHFSPGRREAVLRGALVSAYLSNRPALVTGRPGRCGRSGCWMMWRRQKGGIWSIRAQILAPSRSGLPARGGRS